MGSAASWTSRYPTAEVFSDYAPQEIEVHSSLAWAFVRELWTEVLGMHPGATRVHLGGDEFAGTPVEKSAWAKGVSAWLPLSPQSTG